jgi:hypothetical protein
VVWLWLAMVRGGLCGSGWLGCCYSDGDGVVFDDLWGGVSTLDIIGSTKLL